MSARETVMSALGTLLATIPDAIFFRSRQAALAREEGTGILLEPEEERVEKRAQGPDLVFRRLTVIITVLTRGDVPDQIADGYLAQIQSQFLADPKLGGRCSQIVEQSTRWTFAEADLSAGMAEVRYDVLYQTLAANLLTVQ